MRSAALTYFTAIIFDICTDNAYPILSIETIIKKIIKNAKHMQGTNQIKAINKLQLAIW